MESAGGKRGYGVRWLKVAETGLRYRGLVPVDCCSDCDD